MNHGVISINLIWPNRPRFWQENTMFSPIQEEERQRKLVDQAQQQEMMEVEQAQRAQFLGFSNAWDKHLGQRALRW